MHEVVPSGSEHRALGWASIGGALVSVGALAGVSFGLWGAGEHLWGDDYFLAGFAASLLIAMLGLYVLLAEFIGGIGPVRLPLPLTRREREAKQAQIRQEPDSATGLRSDKTASQRSPLEAWLEGRIEAHDMIVRERAVREEREYQEQMGDWDTQNVNELGGIDSRTLKTDRSIALAPELVKSYRTNPRSPGRVDGIEAPHTADVWDAYYERRLGWLKETLQRLRESGEPAPDTPSVAERASKEPISPEHRDMLKGVADCLLSYVRASQGAYYGRKGDERKAQSFQEHFPELAQQVAGWNARIESWERAKEDLRRWVAGRLHAFGYDRPPFGGGLDLPIAHQAQADVPQLVFSEILGCLHLGPYVVMALEEQGGMPPPAVDRGRVERELDEILVEGAGRPERQRAREIGGSLPSVRDRLLSVLELVQEKDVIKGLGGCELCR